MNSWSIRAGNPREGIGFLISLFMKILGLG